MKHLLNILSGLLLTIMFSTVTVVAETKAPAQAKDATFSEAELDQMMAPIALYPDSLLAQILMASTYPADVADAVKWSKDNSKQKGDKAVEAVKDKSWDPSVMSLVAFPQVLSMMGEKPDWVQQVGDAFLADSETVMDTVQKLRKKAKDAGNLETSKEQKVTVEEPSSGDSVIIIEPADPQIVYVPAYNPTIVYGTWWWPAYSPWYYHPYGYGFGSVVVAGIGFGIGIGITNALWGGCHWGHGHGSIDINVNKYNNININSNRLDGKKGKSDWKHNSNNRRGVPYKDKKSRQKFDNKRAGADKRNDFRGRDAERNKARQTLDKRGVDPAKARKDLKGAGGVKVRDSVNKTNREFSKGNIGNRDFGNAGKSHDFGKASNKRDLGSSSSRQTKSRDNAFSGFSNRSKSRQSFSRGSSSHRSMSSRGGGFGGGGRLGGGGGRRR